MNTMWLRDTVRQTSRGNRGRPAMWLRDTVRQTSRGKSAAAGPTAGRPRPLTSRGMSAWPYRVTTKYSFYPVRTHEMLNNCTNCALKWEIPWFEGELLIHTCMTSPAKWADVTCQVKPEGRTSVQYTEDCTWPIKNRNTNMDLFNT